MKILSLLKKMVTKLDKKIIILEKQKTDIGIKNQVKEDLLKNGTEEIYNNIEKQKTIQVKQFIIFLQSLLRRAASLLVFFKTIKCSILNVHNIDNKLATDTKMA